MAVSATSLPRLGPYTLEAELGRGGMGIVYRAVDSRLGRRVALKVVQQHLAAELGLTRADLQQRLRQEAHIAAQLAHPGIVTIYAYEEVDDVSLISMEHVDGQTLAELLALGIRWTSDEALHLLERFSEALANVHKAGIVHRDLKPANLMLTRDGRCKILDFGIAKFTPQEGNREISRLHFGTVHYMAPEQVLGHQASPAADVWALGVVAYELIRGTPLFNSTSTITTASQITRGIRFETGEQWTASTDHATIFATQVQSAFPLLQGALRVDPRERITNASEMIAFIHHVRGASTFDIATDQAATGRLTFPSSRTLHSAHLRTVRTVGLLLVSLVIGTLALAQWMGEGPRRAGAIGGSFPSYMSSASDPQRALPAPRPADSLRAIGTIQQGEAPPVGPAKAYQTLHYVSMIGDSQGYRFEPANITIQPGDAVRFTLVSGGPHNIAFDPAELTDEAALALAANMPDQVGLLTGKMLLNHNEDYIVSFVGVPPGTYEFNCTPHLAMGMKGSVSIVSATPLHDEVP